MKKSNVTGINESQPVGWLIYLPDTADFLFSYMNYALGSSRSYVKEPANALMFNSERQAFRFSTFIDKNTEIVPLFDFGDKLAVVFSDDPEA